MFLLFCFKNIANKKGNKIAFLVVENHCCCCCCFFSALLTMKSSFSLDLEEKWILFNLGRTEEDFSHMLCGWKFEIKLREYW